jgi:hypothetical protein
LGNFFNAKTIFIVGASTEDIFLHVNAKNIFAAAEKLQKYFLFLHASELATDFFRQPLASRPITCSAFSDATNPHGLSAFLRKRNGVLRGVYRSMY